MRWSERPRRHESPMGMRSKPVYRGGGFFPATCAAGAAMIRQSAPLGDGRLERHQSASQLMEQLLISADTCSAHPSGALFSLPDYGAWPPRWPVVWAISSTRRQAICCSTSMPNLSGERVQTA